MLTVSQLLQPLPILWPIWMMVISMKKLYLFKKKFFTVRWWIYASKNSNRFIGRKSVFNNVIKNVVHHKFVKTFVFIIGDRISSLNLLQLSRCYGSHRKISLENVVLVKTKFQKYHFIQNFHLQSQFTKRSVIIYIKGRD